MLNGIGLAGCGRIGQPMLTAMINAGFDARGYDIRPSGDYGDFAQHITNDVNAFAEGLRILFSVVRDIPQTEALLFNDQQLVARASDLEVVIICSTLSPDYVRELRNRVPEHIDLIDSPMSGAQIAAIEARLSFMQGGAAKLLGRLRPLFDAMGCSVHHMGDYGAGMQTKVLNNMIAASNILTTRLALDWATDAGLDQEKFLALVDVSSGQNWFASNFHDIEFAQDGFAPDNTIGILKKDVEAALDAAPYDADRRLPELLARLAAELRPKR